MTNNKMNLEKMLADDILKIGKDKLPSPIDLDVRKMKLASLPDIVWHNSNEPPRVMKITNCGFSLILTAKWLGPSRPYISGEHLPGNYIFSQAHFHWGKTNDRGSEHTVEGKAQPLELHVIYFKTDYKTMEEAMKTLDGIVVVAYLYNVRKVANAELTPIIESLSKVVQPNTSAPVDIMPVSNFAPTFNEDYFLYWGTNLTTAGYNILWLICRRAQTISAEQLSEFRKLIGENKEPLVDNFRELKSINGRTILFANPGHNTEQTLLMAPVDPVQDDVPDSSVITNNKRPKARSVSPNRKLAQRKSSTGRRKSKKRSEQHEKSSRDSSGSQSEGTGESCVVDSNETSDHEQTLERYESFEDYEPKEQWEKDKQLPVIDDCVQAYIMSKKPYDPNLENTDDTIMPSELSNPAGMNEDFSPIKVSSKVYEWEEITTASGKLSADKLNTLMLNPLDQLLGLFPEQMAGQFAFPEGFIDKNSGIVIEGLPSSDILPHLLSSNIIPIADEGYSSKPITENSENSESLNNDKPIPESSQPVEPAKNNDDEDAKKQETNNIKGKSAIRKPAGRPSYITEMFRGSQSENQGSPRRPRTPKQLPPRTDRQSTNTRIPQSSSPKSRRDSPVIFSRKSSPAPPKLDDLSAEAVKSNADAEKPDERNQKVNKDIRRMKNPPVQRINARDGFQKRSAKIFELPSLAKKKAELLEESKTRVRPSPILGIFGKTKEPAQDEVKTVPNQEPTPVSDPKIAPLSKACRRPQTGVNSSNGITGRKRYPILAKHCKDLLKDESDQNISPSPQPEANDLKEPACRSRIPGNARLPGTNLQRANLRNTSPSWKY